MTIKDFYLKLNRYITTSIDLKRIISLVETHQNDIHLCDLDCALFYVYAGIPELIDKKGIEALADSDYISILVPEYNMIQQAEVIHEKLLDIVKSEVVDFAHSKMTKELNDEIGNHTLINEVDLTVINSVFEVVSNIKNNIKIDLETSHIYSYPLSQARHHFIYSLTITNLSDYLIDNISIEFDIQPSFIEIDNVQVNKLPPNQPICKEEFGVHIDSDGLLNITEKQIGTITVRVLKEGIELNISTQEIEFLPYNTFTEYYIPNSSAVFVMPNDESVQNIIRLTQKTLEGETNYSALDDYQSGYPDRIMEQVKALYDTLFNQGIGYITAPASYDGQKVRLPFEVLTGKQGTCLDLSLLFLSCIEAMGLNGGLVLVHGHAFACVFLENINFRTSPFNDAIRALDSCENNNDLIFVNCVDFCAGNDISFELSILNGKSLVKDAFEDEFFQIIDIKNARSLDYLPLPIKYEVGKITVDLKVLEQNEIRLKKKEQLNGKETVQLTDAELSRFDIWEKKLLDLSKRNELIDFKINRNGQQIMTFDSDEGVNLQALFDAFSTRTGYYNILPSIFQANNPSVIESPDMVEDAYQIMVDQFSKKNLMIMKRAINPIASFRFFDRERRRAFEESGSNILYLVLGFIEWFETDRSKKPIYSPVILVPIDLKRNSKDSYSIIGRGEPAFFNISIFELFRQEFKMNFDDILVNDLLSDDDVKINAILNTVNEKLKKIKRARIVKAAAINIFKFSKSVMWQNIKYNKDEMARNKVIKSIISNAYIVKENEQLIESFDDDKLNPIDYAIPLSADSSQTKAIIDCAAGKSFILQGPPGTGKSQTITNMIVNSIYNGKTVLFVAEKMAALEVVQKRLADLSLDGFALEAHSINASKENIMEQFNKRIEMQKTKSDTNEFYKVSNELKEKKDNLNRIINLLHKKNDYFISFYDAFVNYLSIDDVEELELDDDYVKLLDYDTYKKHEKLVGDFFNQLKENNGYYKNPFILYQSSNYIPNVTKNKYRMEVSEYLDVLNRLVNCVKQLLNKHSIILQLSRQNIGKFIQLIDDLKRLKINTSLLKSDLLNEQSELLNICDAGLKYQTEYKKIISSYSKVIFELDYDNYLFQIDRAKNSGFFAKKRTKRKITNDIKQYSVYPRAVKFKNLDDLRAFIINLKEINSLKEQVNAGFNNYSSIFVGDVLNFDFNTFKAIFENTLKIKKDYIDFISVYSIISLSKIIGDNEDLSFEEAKELYSEICRLEDGLTKDLSFDFDLCQKYQYTYEDILVLLSESLSKLDYIKNWCVLISKIHELRENNLSFMFDYVDKLSVNQINNLSLIYNKSIFIHVINKAMIGDENGSFNAIEIKEKIKEYKKLLGDYKELIVKETAALITKNTPYMDEQSVSTSQIGILRKAIGNKCRGKSIRKLFEETQNILTKFFPVFLMSPISCAQYLSMDMPKFDIVIFDEASQMPTSEAVGAIARGNSLVVVGDSMQMPPTSFFQAKSTDNDYADIDDQESILDDCNVIGLPSHRLEWHYRSKHESLIRFSNTRFYNNSLVTFPSPNDMENKIEFRNVKGVYDRKGKNTNEKEADAIITEIKRRLLDPELRKRSIGVVTFSQSQQALVEDKMDDLINNDREIEKIVNEMTGEKIIIKNLENIQGDERDVILFSICYGPTIDGKMYYNFGPVNYAGGEKRLNVAFSRARYEMIIFASFEPELLSQMKSESKGANELYQFLKYAKHGDNSLAISANSFTNVKVGIEKDIAKRLEAKGFKTAIDVGKSSFRVDIGIIDPDNPNRYILGVVCDSYSYENAQTSKDRYVVQPTVLQLLGWNIYRIWSFDYLDDKEAVINNIIEKIQEVQNGVFTSKKKDDSKVIIEFEKEEIKKTTYARPYVKYQRFNKVDSDHYSSLFYSQIKKVVSEILQVEAPISLNQLYARVAESINAGSCGTLIQKAIHSALTHLDVKKSKTGETYFFWLSTRTELEYYRTNDAFSRDITDIPKEEVFIAIKENLINNGFIQQSGLIQATSKCLGFKALTQKNKNIINYIINKYIDDGKLELDKNGYIRLKGDK